MFFFVADNGINNLFMEHYLGTVFKILKRFITFDPAIQYLRIYSKATIRKV